MSNGRGSRPPMEEVRGGTAAPRTCTQPIRSLGSTAWGWFRCWIPSGASCRFHEPPDAEPHVRWCGRTAGLLPPPTRSTLLTGACISSSAYHHGYCEGDEALSYSEILVPKKGLEPPHPCGYMDLNHARLPIPPLRHGWKRVRHSTRCSGSNIIVQAVSQG